MVGQLVEGVERAVFGPVDLAQVDAWLSEHARARLSRGVREVLFRSGRVGAVYGLALDDGSRVVVKVHRGAPDARSLTAALACQRVLAAAGRACPAPIDGPATTAGLTAVVEELIDPGEFGDARAPATRSAMAAALADQVSVLRTVGAAVGLTDPPAWARWQHGPWPTPHDPLFAMPRTPPEWVWLDDLARRASADLHSVRAECGPSVTGHGDWCCANVTFAHRDVVTVAAAYDWDSLVHDSEAVIAGMSAGSHTHGSQRGSQVASPEDVDAYLADYAAARGAPLTAAEHVAATAAATWVLAYNARCDLALLPAGDGAASGSSLEALQRSGADHEALRRR